jgi:hypothetical protein
MALIAEKSLYNFQTKSRRPEDLYYFAVQHSFKQMNLQKLFKIDEKTSQQTDYKSLDFGHFKQINGELSELIQHLRNLNAHFLHSFDVLKEENISFQTLTFLKDSFRLAVVQSYIDEKISEISARQIGVPLTGVQKNEIIDKCLENEGAIIHFLKTMFSQKLYAKTNRQTEHYTGNKREENKEFTAFISDRFATLDKAVDFILFVETPKDINWELKLADDSADDNQKRELMTITQGRYLSFCAIVFLFSMFLYKNEAKVLIPRISKFKKSGTLESQRKLNLFSFYAKQFNTQDIDNKDKKLIFFREIMQYLGQYPVEWNRALEGEDTEILKDFKTAIYCQEIEKQFPAFANHDSFKLFALGYLFRNEKSATTNNWGLWKDIIDKESRIIDVYKHIKINNLKAKSYKRYDHYDYYVLKYLIDNYFPGKSHLAYQKFVDKRNMHVRKFNQNLNTQILKNRIAFNLILPSYARNYNCFLKFGIRYLAENNYFGETALFKMYRYYYSIEQQEIYETLDRKERDRLKFKGGKEVTYKTYAASIEEYPDWDAPFVMENNAVFVKFDENSRPFAIQSDLMIYFLEDALYSENVKNSGLKMIEYFNELDKEKNEAIELLQQRQTIVKEEKNRFKKILPRHLLNNYLAAEPNDENVTVNGLQNILNYAEKQEKRYNCLKKRAIYLDELQIEHQIKTEIEKSREALFDDKNKSKNFKLTFIRKACHIMYFRDIYAEKSKTAGHHKQLHITRDEYNNFCKWMSAFDAVPCYKILLTDLFASKGFLENGDFREIIEESGSLDEVYEKVKQKYRNWLIANNDITKKRKYNLESYADLLNNGVRYINVWHFKQFLTKNDSLQYCSLENNKHLFTAYYIEKPDDKTQMKLWNSLQKAKHEDCLLYRLALRYFQADGTVKQYAKELAVDRIFCSVFEFRQEYEIDGQNGKYTVLVPLKDMDKWFELQKFSETKKLLQRLPAYLTRNRFTKELKSIAQKFFASNEEILLSDLSTVNKHIINYQTKFICCIMALEEFYIGTCSPEEYSKMSEQEKINYQVGIKDIAVLKDYPEIANHNAASHFDLPIDKSYQDVFAEIEKQFSKEIDKGWTVETLPRMHRNVMEIFLEKMRNDVFDQSVVLKNNKSGDAIKQINMKETHKKSLENYLKELQDINS